MSRVGVGLSIAFILASATLAGMIALLVTSRMPVIHEGRALLLVGPGSTEYNDLLAAGILTETYASLAVTRPVLNAAALSAGLDRAPEELGVRVSAIPERDSLTLQIVARAPDEEVAVDMANAVASELTLFGASQDPTVTAAGVDLVENLRVIAVEIGSVNSQIGALVVLENPTQAQTSRLTGLQERLTTLQVAQATILGEARQARGETIRLIDPAVIGMVPPSPNTLLNTAVAVVVAIVAAVALVVLVRLPSGVF